MCLRTKMTRKKNCGAEGYAFMPETCLDSGIRRIYKLSFQNKQAVIPYIRQNIEPRSWLVSCQFLSLIHIKTSSFHAWCHPDCPFLTQSIVSNHLRRTDEDESQTYQCTSRPFPFPRSRMTWRKYTLFSIIPQYRNYCMTFKKGINRNNALILRSDDR